MSRVTISTLFVLSLLFLGSCGGAANSGKTAQDLVESLKAKNANVVRLTVHAIPSGGTKYVAIASTLASKLGEPSDPEDLKAIQTGEIVVLEEKGALDVTVPIQLKDGKHNAATGVTLKDSLGREAAIAAAKTIAAEIDRGLTKATTKK